MFADKKQTIKRKSPLTINDAEQTSNGVSYLETFSRSGQKIEKDDAADIGGTTFFKKETIGKIKYFTEGNINLSQLQFISCDPIFDRFSFNSDSFRIYKQVLENTLPNFDSELGYYTLSSSVVDQSEHGIKLSEENVIFLVKELGQNQVVQALVKHYRSLVHHVLWMRKISH
jgi:hypothetical protein